MLTDDLKIIKSLADEAFSEIEDSDEFSEEVQASLLTNLDDIGIIIDACLSELDDANRT